MPGLRQFPGQVLGVPQALVQALGAERPQEVGGVPGEEGPPGTPPPGQPVVERVHAGVEQLVGRGLAAPARQGVADAGDQGVRGDEFAPRREEPVEPPDPVGQRARGDLGAARAPGRRPVQHGLARPGQLGAERGDGVPLHRRTAREADVQQLAHGGPCTVAAHQVASAPPGGSGPPGVRGDAVGVLFQCVEPAEGHQAHQLVCAGRGPQTLRQGVLGQMDGRRQRDGAVLLAQRHGPHQLLAAHRPPAGPAQAVLVQRRAAEPQCQVRGVLAQDDGAGRTRFVLPGALVEHDGGDALVRERERQREAHRTGADDDHRVHGEAPRRGAGRREEGDEGGEADARGAITERMQLTAGACVK